MQITGSEVAAIFATVAAQTMPGSNLSWDRTAELINTLLDEKLFRLAAAPRTTVAVVAPRKGPAVALVGKCRICGCTDAMACCLTDRTRIIRPCAWVNEEHTLCDNPLCIASAADGRGLDPHERIAGPPVHRVIPRGGDDAA